jgi:NDP-sugar pyrophosphorylase family protein
VSEEFPPAAVLAGGLGTRIRSVTGGTPKVLLPVEGRPFLAHLLERLQGEGVARAVLLTGHGAPEVWEEAVRCAPPGLDLEESREETPRGTGGALRDALPRLGGTFFLLNGDTWLDASLAGLLALHRAHRAVLSLLLVPETRAEEKGTVRLGPDGLLTGFAEKTGEGSGLINAGVYAVDARALEGAAPTGLVSLEKEIIPALLAGGHPVAGQVVDAPFVDIGLPEDYDRVRDALPRRINR